MILTALALLAGPVAHAGADLVTILDLPASTEVYADDVYRVTVENNGNRHANNVQLVVQLPETNSSPSVYVMGEVTGLDSACYESGTQLVCDLGRIRKNNDATIEFDMWLPWSAGSLDFTATASSSTSEDAPADNTDSAAAAQTYVDLVIAGPAAATNRHCTGTGLEAFYTCTLFPSSISSHDIVFESTGDITIVGVGPEYTGTWDQDSDDHLWFEYRENGSVVAEFEGNGVGGNCFEGLTTFPGSSWVAPYEVCL